VCALRCGLQDSEDLQHALSLTVCVCVCVGVYMCVYVRVCACVCVCTLSLQISSRKVAHNPRLIGRKRPTRYSASYKSRPNRPHPTPTHIYTHPLSRSPHTYTHTHTHTLTHPKHAHNYKDASAVTSRISSSTHGSHKQW